MLSRFGRSFVSCLVASGFGMPATPVGAVGGDPAVLSRVAAAARALDERAGALVAVESSGLQPETPYLHEIVTALAEVEEGAAAGRAAALLDEADQMLAEPAESLALYRRVVERLNAGLLEMIRGEERATASAVVEKARAAVGMTSPVYGVVTHNDLTQGGRLACAAVVSAVLREAGQGVGVHYNCLGLRGALASRGWDRVGASDIQSGDVAFWGEDLVTRPRHVGLVVGHTGFAWTVDNNSILRMVVVRPLSRVEWMYQHGMRR